MLGWSFHTDSQSQAPNFCKRHPLLLLPPLSFISLFRFRFRFLSLSLYIPCRGNVLTISPSKSIHIVHYFALSKQLSSTQRKTRNIISPSSLTFIFIAFRPFGWNLRRDRSGEAETHRTLGQTATSI